MHIKNLPDRYARQNKAVDDFYNIYSIFFYIIKYSIKDTSEELHLKVDRRLTG